jgi:HAD superfamily hydrolase (TIGR01509 family)
MPIAPFCAVVFDCDGVLVDSETLGLRSLQQALQEAGVKYSFDSLTRFSGRSHGETLRETSTESGIPLNEVEVSERMDDIYREIVRSEGLLPCPGVPELLEKLTSSGVPFTLASSGPRSKVTFSLRSAGLSGAFPRFICGDDVRYAKPSPDVYLAAALLGIPPAECLAIEDAPSGVSAALAAGMQAVAITSSFAPNALAEAHLVLTSVSEFPLETMGAAPGALWRRC